MSNAKLRVLIAEDSLTVRTYLAEVLSRSPGIEVIAEAVNGKEAVELCRKHRPDVITMDVVMPEMNGLEATEQIMAFAPTPILIVSSSANRAEAFKAYDALAAGAIDVLEKPPGDAFNEEWERNLVSMVRLVSRIRVITHLRGKLKWARHASPEPLKSEPGLVADSKSACVAIGASTGGPGAVLSILRSLPSNFPVPIFLVIHIGEQFGITLPEWLSSSSGFQVSVPKNGSQVPTSGTGQVLMAPPNRHLVVRSGRTWLLDAPERHSCRPSVDTLFESVAVEYGRRAVAALLTGMGKDGAEGLLRIKQAGGATLCQDEATSVIFGMPREAIALGAAQSILPLGEIGPALTRLAGMS